jgi:hypothetical protein
VRWWKIVGPVLDAATPERPLDRATLRVVALKLDLESQDSGRWQALAHSPQVDVRLSLRGYFAEAEIDTVVAAVGPSAPRRVVLTAALLITGLPAALGALSIALSKELADVRTKISSTEGSEFSEVLATLKDREKRIREQMFCISLDFPHAFKSATASDPQNEIEFEFHNDVRRKLFTETLPSLPLDGRCDKTKALIGKCLLSVK